MKDCDQVKVLVDRQKYLKNGVCKGMIGTIVVDEPVNGEWLVYFSDHTGSDIAEASIKEEDLEVIRSSKLN